MENKPKTTFNLLAFLFAPMYYAGYGRLVFSFVLCALMVFPITTVFVAILVSIYAGFRANRDLPVGEIKFSWESALCLFLLWSASVGFLLFLRHMGWEWNLEFVIQTWLSGGVVMLPLALVAVLMYTVAVNLLINFRQRSFRYLKDETITNWVAEPDQGEGEVGEIIRYTQDDVRKVDEVHSRFSEVIASRLPFFERRLVFLNTLVATAPLLGLLGTVMGMLMTFKGLSVGGGKLVDVVASGISEALITTEMGLLIAVPGYFMAYAIKRRKDEYEAFLVRLESLTLQQFKRKGFVV